MKTTIKGILACVLVGCLITSCKKKEDTIEMNEQTEMTDSTATDSTMMMPAATDTMANTESSSTPSDMQNAKIKSGSDNTKTNNGSSSGSREKSTKSTGKSSAGYSAPDGTDAENNDGDQYTKNDKTRMPSGGSSIK